MISGATLHYTEQLQNFNLKILNTEGLSLHYSLIRFRIITEKVR